MQISIDTATATREDAIGLIVLLNSVSPGALQAAALQIGQTATVTVGNVSVSGPAAEVLTRHSLPPHDPATGEVIDEAEQAFGAAPDPHAAFGAPDPLGGAGSAQPPAPVAPDATPPQTADAGRPPVDKDGFPWDPRIHSTVAGGGGSINKGDGLWRAKKGVSADLVASVQAELRSQGYHAPAPAPAAPEMVGGEQLPQIPAPPAGGAAPGAVIPPPPPQTSDSAAGASTGTPPPPPPAASPAPSPPAPPAGSVPKPIDLFQALMKKVNPAQTSGLLTVTDIVGICETVGIRQLGDLLTQPQHIPVVEAQIDALIEAAGGAA